MKRRDALKTIGGLAGAASIAKFLPACGSDDSGPVGITTYVFMMMENRSYDHYFGSRKLVEGLPGDGLVAGMQNPDLNNVQIPIYAPDQDHECVIDPPHDWDAQHNSWNSADGKTGLCDGFVKSHQTDHNNDTTHVEPMQYHTRDHIPVSYALADEYATADRWFCSVMGPTWPNRFYWHVGSSRGIKSNQLPTTGGGIAGPSIYHHLNDAGIDWAYYYGSVPVVALVTDLDITGKVRRMTEFFTDAKAGKLPPVVYIDPAFNDNDDHPPIHPINGQELIASVYKALAESPQWKNIMFVLTYDENGGFFDHVSPPQTDDDYISDGFDQMGFRVPTIVMGPYIKQGFVSSVVYDHTSCLKHLEKVYGLPPLSRRTTAANDLSDFIDQDRLDKGKWNKPVAIPDVDITQWPMSATCDPSTAKTAMPPHPIEVIADQHPELIAGLDLRGEIPEYRKAIRDFLKQRR